MPPTPRRRPQATPPKDAYLELITNHKTPEWLLPKPEVPLTLDEAAARFTPKPLPTPRRRGPGTPPKQTKDQLSELPVFTSPNRFEMQNGMVFDTFFKDFITYPATPFEEAFVILNWLNQSIFSREAWKVPCSLGQTHDGTKMTITSACAECEYFEIDKPPVRECTAADWDSGCIGMGNPREFEDELRSRFAAKADSDFELEVIKQMSVPDLPAGVEETIAVTAVDGWKTWNVNPLGLDVREGEKGKYPTTSRVSLCYSLNQYNRVTREWRRLLVRGKSVEFKPGAEPPDFHRLKALHAKFTTMIEAS